MEQNVIAVIWDYDKTLVNGYMQTPIFKAYGVDEREFWHEVESIKHAYRKSGLRVNSDTLYLNHFITCVKQGIFEGLDNAKLKAFGAELDFYPGVPEIFARLKQAVKQNEKYRAFNITVENYVVSTGLAEMIRGSKIYDHVDGVWGCEFIEQPIVSQLGGEALDTPKEITQIGYALDNTSKTRALFEINKGSNKFENIDVNANIRAEDRRVPFNQMIYIADGPSDIPAFSVITGNGGKAYAIYPKGDAAAMRQVNRLQEDNRVNMFGEADYREGTTTEMWLTQQVEAIAERINTKKKRLIEESVSDVPKHLD
jgi:hypothetical protein